MKIAVTGTVGQVVSSLVERGIRAGHEVVAIGRPKLDLAEPGSILPALQAIAPDLVISAAAYTAVDKAEAEADTVFAINADGAEAVAHAARSLGVPLVHISTDYVFDGRSDRAYRETDPVGPSGIYGASKLLGEEKVLSAYPANTAVLRVAWVYSPFGGNFVKTMLRLANDRDEISVVADQRGSPTNALDIADGILAVGQHLFEDDDPALRGLFHMTAQGEAVWADFAEAIFSGSASLQGPSATVRRITTAEYPTPAQRPANSLLDCGLIARVHGVALPHWRDSLGAVIPRILAAT